MIKVIDLFAGAGGLSYGFKMAGDFCFVAAAEINKDAQETYLKNIVDDQEHFEMMGWKVLIVWECELRRDNIDSTMSELIKTI